MLIAYVYIPPTVISRNLVNVNQINDYVTLSIIDDFWVKKDVKQIKSCIYNHKFDADRKEFIIKKSTGRNKNNPTSHDIARQKWLKNNP